MQESDWKSLIWSLQHQNCILFLGPDIGCPTQSSSPIRFTQELTAQLALALGATDEPDLPLVAHRYRKERSPNDLQREVVEFCAIHENDRCDILADFAALPFYLVVTSCHDSLLRMAFDDEQKTPQVEAYNFRGGIPDNLDMGTVTHPLIYHLYGSPKVPSSLVLTEHDLIDFLVAIVSKNPPLPQSISAEIRKPAKSLLFVGFGIKQWHQRILIHLLRSTAPVDSRSFALDAFDEVSSKALERTVFFYKNQYKLEVFQTDLPTFAHELRRRFGQAPQAAPLLPSTGPGPALPSPKVFPALPSPKVFICYASEDRTRVHEVCGQLRGAGLDTWMDQTSLEGGDDWDRVIKESLYEVDYFLVFQSHALLNKQFSYVNKEIKLALERQQFARQGYRFIIPIQIDDCPVLQEFQGFQAVRLTDQGKASELARSLVREHQLRIRR